MHSGNKEEDRACSVVQGSDPLKSLAAVDSGHSANIVRL